LEYRKIKSFRLVVNENEGDGLFSIDGERFDGRVI